MVKVLGKQELPDAVEGVRTEVGNGDKGLMDPLSSEGLTGIRTTENWGCTQERRGGTVRANCKRGERRGRLWWVISGLGGARGRLGWSGE